jgi:hypothetical protein
VRIPPTGPSGNVARARGIGRREAARPSAFADRLGRAAAAESTGAAPVTPLTSLDAVLAAQAVGDPAERARQAIRHGEDVLDELETLRLALIDGRVPEDVLRGLGARLEARRARADDPRIEQLIEEIELRAAVELAKLERDELREA